MVTDNVQWPPPEMITRALIRVLWWLQAHASSNQAALSLIQIFPCQLRTHGSAGLALSHHCLIMHVVCLVAKSYSIGQRVVSLADNFLAGASARAIAYVRGKTS